MEQHDGRTYVVTGAGSGIGAATAAWLRACGGRVITSDLRGCDVSADLSTVEGRSALVEGISRLADRIDGIVANAGGGPAETMLALNFFGTIASINGLARFANGTDARAVVVSSASCLGPFDDALVYACLGGDEPKAIELGVKAMMEGKTALHLYGSAKRALKTWCRRIALTPEWAGRGATLNAVAFGVIETPAADWILKDPASREQLRKLAPLLGAHPGQPGQAAALLGWCVAPDNSLMTGQVLFADGGFECLTRGDGEW